MYFGIVVWFCLILTQRVIGFQKACEEYFEGFSLPEDYNRNLAPKDNITIFAMQHVEDIVKVKISNTHKYCDRSNNKDSADHVLHI